MTNPGWYDDHSEGIERYHDGTAWTENRRQKGSAVQQGGSPALGYILAVIIPIIGFIIGIVYLAGSDPNKKKHGGWVMGLSVLAGVIYIALVSNSGSGSTY